MLQAPSSPEQNRDADIANGQLGYIYLFAEGQGMLNFRGEISYEDTSGYEWRNLGSSIGADILIPVCSTTKLVVSAEGQWTDYFDSSTLRKDTIVTASLGINHKLTENIFLTLQHSYTRAMSNVDLYDYQRNLTTTGIEFRF